MKKRLLIVALLAALAAFPLAAQTLYSEYEDAFQDFADGVADALPMNAAIGLNWSDSYIGNFPHFGVGLAVGAAAVPWEAFEKVDSMLGGTISSEYSELEDYGAPIPAVAIEGRIGGFILPFDIGVKVGFIPDETKALLPSGVTADYLMFGADVRYALLKGGAVMPKLVVGAGYTYLKGTVSMADVVSDSYNVGGNIIAGASDLTFDWEASVIDLKAQISKGLFVITPYLGVGASLSVAQAGGGLDGQVTVNGDAADPAEIAAIEAYTGEDFDPDKGFFVSSSENGWSFRLYGGVSVNLLAPQAGPHGHVQPGERQLRGFVGRPHPALGRAQSLRQPSARPPRGRASFCKRAAATLPAPRALFPLQPSSIVPHGPRKRAESPR